MNETLNIQYKICISNNNQSSIKYLDLSQDKEIKLFKK